MHIVTKSTSRKYWFIWIKFCTNQRFRSSFCCRRIKKLQQMNDHDVSIKAEIRVSRRFGFEPVNISAYNHSSRQTEAISLPQLNSWPVRRRRLSKSPVGWMGVAAVGYCSLLKSAAQPPYCSGAALFGIPAPEEETRRGEPQHQQVAGTGESARHVSSGLKNHTLL